MITETARPQRRRRCPRCRSAGAEPIIYGLVAPGPNGDLADVYLAGSMVTDDDPKWHCSVCGHKWGRHAPDRRYTVHVRVDDETGEYLGFVTDGLPENTSAATYAPTVELLVGFIREAIEAATGEAEFAVDYVLSEQLLARVGNATG